MVNFKGGHVFSFTVDFSTFIVLLPCFEAVLLSFIYQIKLLRHLGLTSRKHVRIVQCDIYAFVSQTSGDIYRRKAHRDQKRYVRVTQIVKPDAFYTSAGCTSIHLGMKKIPGHRENPPG